MPRIETDENNGNAGYTLGAIARLTCRPLDDTGAAVDPTTVSVTITLPDGTSAGPFTYAASAITRHASYFVTGDIVYRYLYTTTQSGTHTYTFTTTGTYASVARGQFEVLA
jgi:hypothetical protein